MDIDTHSVGFWAPIVGAVLHFVLGVFVRPRVSSETWNQLGTAGKALDVTFGNYGSAANKVDP